MYRGPPRRKPVQAMLDRRHTLIGLGVALAGGASITAANTTTDYQNPDEIYGALRSLPATTLAIGGGTIRVVFVEDAGAPDRGLMLAWIRAAAEAVTAYFGRFPVTHYGLLVIAQPGDAVGHATTFGYAGSATHINVGLNATKQAFGRDWVLVHEMVHTALPNLPRRALWLQEGNATYIEPIARALIGGLPASEAWRESVMGMPKGLPRPDEGGMDGTSRWGRLYWGGAAFWLLAEIAIYVESRGVRSLRDALRRINRDSGGNSVLWSPEKVMRSGDAATGGTALIDLYTRFAVPSVRPDLGSTFERLGISMLPDGSVSFDDRAPLAELRRQITTRSVP